MLSIRWMLLAIPVVFLACSAPKEEAPKPAAQTQSAAQVQADAPATAADTVAAAKCVHGVDQTLCTRCDPRLEAVFKAKGDWCAEHSRPESQCVLCNPELAALGVK
ncbi:MAG TPA: hypothetical protein VNM87_07275 [Candidatus Udaeobacter sp.]|nr:hypothetical protein [Candidatus Udaeobacter sp.]